MDILFLCDLDNTLLYSYKHKSDGDVCVEILNGCEQSFVSQRGCDLLDEVLCSVDLIPVTTRSVAQYERIVWPYGSAPRTAVAANGAILLRDGERDLKWLKRSESMAAAAYDDMTMLLKILECDNRVKKCRIVDGMYLFAYCYDEEGAKRCVYEYGALKGLNAADSGRKVYFFPEGIDKGSAAAELKRIFKPELVICAGDSRIDIPMLDLADIAVVPTAAMAEQVKSRCVRVNCGGNFSEFVLTAVSELIK